MSGPLLRKAALLGGVALASAVAAWLLVSARLDREPAAAPARGALPAGTFDPAAWRKLYPRQYLEWREPSRVDARWGEKRGHAYSLKDR